MRALSLLCAAIATGCAVHCLPTTLFHVGLDRGATTLTEHDWLALAHAGPDTNASSIAAATSISSDEWIVWTTRDDGAGALMRARRTDIGLEAQAIGEHRGPIVRPTLRALRVGDALIVVAESSISEASTDRDAWLYVEDDRHFVPLMLAGTSARLRVRGEGERPIEPGWARAAVQTATIDADAIAIVVHEHESVREVAEGPGQRVRSGYEVERARRLTLSRGTLRADRPSLFDAAP